MTGLVFQDTTALLKGLEAGEFSSVELLGQLLGQADQVNDKVNAIITFDRDRAFALAKTADADRKAGKATGALHGLPMTIKDTYETEGLRTTAGAPEFQTHIPKTDALETGMTPLELGSDLAGSIRVPAAFCGVYGHKPSFGIVPLRGHIPGPPGTLSTADLAVSGPLARSARDSKLAMSVLVGPDPEHA